jgi:hypothetical protein
MEHAIVGFELLGDPQVRLDILNDKEGVWRCRTTFNCTDACPCGIEVTKAISEVKQAILKGNPNKVDIVLGWLAGRGEPNEPRNVSKLWVSRRFGYETDLSSVADRGRGLRPTMAMSSHFSIAVTMAIALGKRGPRISSGRGLEG